MSDIGLTHVALATTDVEASIRFYAAYADMHVMHRRIDEEINTDVVWLSDKTRPFAIVLIQTDTVPAILLPFSHLGVGCKSRKHVDRLCEKARSEGVLAKPPTDSGYPTGYWAFLRDPDGHTLELSYGQEIGLTVERRT